MVTAEIYTAVYKIDEQGIVQTGPNLELEVLGGYVGVSSSCPGLA
jgi:hypothetical protein